MEDRQILELFYERSEQAIEETVQKYGRLARRVAENVLCSGEDAEECLNDSCLGLWNTIPPRQPCSLRAYFLGVTRNLALKRYHANTAQRRNSHYDVALDELEACLPAADTAETRVEARELGLAINRFLATLPKEERQLFLSRYYWGDGVGDIAGYLGTESGNVSVKLFRLREKLRNFLSKEGFTV